MLQILTYFINIPQNAKGRRWEDYFNTFDSEPGTALIFFPKK